MSLYIGPQPEEFRSVPAPAPRPARSSARRFYPPGTILAASTLTAMTLMFGGLMAPTFPHRLDGLFASPLRFALGVHDLVMCLAHLGTLGCAIALLFLDIHQQTFPTVLASFDGERRLGDLSAERGDLLFEPFDVGFFFLGNAEEPLAKVGIRQPTGVLLKLDDVLSLIDVLVAQDLDESLTVVWLERVEKLPPACREDAGECHRA